MGAPTDDVVISSLFIMHVTVTDGIEVLIPVDRLQEETAVSFSCATVLMVENDEMLEVRADVLLEIKVDMVLGIWVDVVLRTGVGVLLGTGIDVVVTMTTGTDDDSLVRSESFFSESWVKISTFLTGAKSSGEGDGNGVTVVASTTASTTVVNGGG